MREWRSVSAPHLRVPQTSHKTAGIVLIIAGSGQVRRVSERGSCNMVGDIPFDLGQIQSWEISYDIKFILNLEDGVRPHLFTNRG